MNILQYLFGLDYKVGVQIWVELLWLYIIWLMLANLDMFIDHPCSSILLSLCSWLSCCLYLYYTITIKHQKKTLLPLCVTLCGCQA